MGGGFLLAPRSHDASTVSEPNLLDVVLVVPMTRGFSPPASGLATGCQPTEALEAKQSQVALGSWIWLADGDHIISQRPLPAAYLLRHEFQDPHFTKCYD